MPGGRCRPARVRPLFGNRTNDWYTYVHREAATPGRNRVILRWNFGTADDPGYAWIVYWIQDADIDRMDLKLEALYIPTEDEPGSEQTTPGELIGEPFFAFP